MLLHSALPVSVLAAIAGLVFASPNYGTGNQICTNAKKWDRAATPYCSSLLGIPVKTQYANEQQVPTVTTCKQPSIPSASPVKHKRNTPPQYKPQCFQPYSGKSLTSACKCLSIKTSTATIATTRYGQQSTVTTTKTASATVFAVPTGPLNLFALGTGNDDEGNVIVNGPNQYLQARQSGSQTIRQAVDFSAPQNESPLIRFADRTLIGVGAPITGLVAGIRDDVSPGTVAVVFDSLEEDNVIAACGITSAPDGTCPVVCGTSGRPFDTYLELWSLASAEEYVSEPIDTFAVSPLLS
ncbi:uncharacterized protein MYCGRDRAFT_93858 [Zymoseptoria tritici IPO323]|uniref:Uncharacterized protein n=1 Tax=Zymoseptoria tritici (strain CBS 115943 / IPO323) TaxID=336722 RepID=F9XD95_ZYMTI|nr:uncharacterized protein MYCGRDRAFT_93858 [Zymoseptoria tritici IPO323]EGP86451.1 hypothetical protein MYCGRDRAFT_93858 [Zymoseptoria tritici IPO323]